MIHDVLRQLGFSQKEAEVYVAVLQNGKISVTDIAKSTGINRTTVYSVAKELLKKKVIREDTESSKTYLLARPPEDLHLLAEKDRLQLNQQEHLIRKAIGELSTLTRDVRYSIPKIVFVDEQELERYLYKETPKWVESVRAYDKTWWGFQDHTFVDHYEKWISWYWTREEYKDTQLKLFSNASDAEQRMRDKQFTRRQIKNWPQEENPVSASLWVNGDYLIMFVTRTRPHYLVEIRDATLAQNMREVFKALWNRV